MAKWKIALDMVEWVHGTIGMFMFILEEAAQTAGMACYVAKREGQDDLVKSIADYAIREICDPGIDFCNTYGAAAYPLHMAYKEFFTAAKKTFQTYLEV